MYRPRDGWRAPALGARGEVAVGTGSCFLLCLTDIQGSLVISPDLIWLLIHILLCVKFISYILLHMDRGLWLHAGMYRIYRRYRMLSSVKIQLALAIKGIYWPMLLKNPKADVFRVGLIQSLSCVTLDLISCLLLALHFSDWI